MKMLHLAGILLTLNGVFTLNPNYGVTYPSKLICAVRGFSVSLPCSYSHPQAAQVKQKLWCSMKSNSDWCINPPYVYNSSSQTKPNYQFIGDDTSNCTLLIRDVQLNYSGEYRFRFITNVEGGKFTGDPGVTLQVTDLKVALIRLGGNETLKQGDSLNLTCDVNCTHTSSQFMWSKNNQPLNTSGRVLHFPTVTLKDSGNYTCTWETSLESGSNTISVQVEAEDRLSPLSLWMACVIPAGVIFIMLVISGPLIYYRRRRFKASEKNEEETGEEPQTNPQLDPEVPDEETLNEEDVTYAAVRVKVSQVNRDPQADEEEVDEGGVIYASLWFNFNKPTKQHVQLSSELL